MIGMRVAWVLAVARFASCESPDYDQLWADFKLKYKRVFKGDEDMRFQIFKAAVEHVAKENTKNHSYTLGIDQFSDRTPEELAQLMNGARAARNPNTGLPYLGQHVRAPGPLPESVDWTMKGALNPVKYQGICGSCWAFAATASLESAAAIADGKLVSLSEQQTMQCSREGTSDFGRGCEGGWQTQVFDYAVDHDICTEASYPYTGDVSMDTLPCFWNINPPVCPEVGLSKDRISGYKSVTPDSMEDLMSAVAQQPVTVGIATEGWNGYRGGIFSGCTSTKNGHAVLVVGYTSEYWKIRNSWGTDFGEDGYIRIQKGAGGEGMCGLLKDPSYPVVTSQVLI